MAHLTSYAANAAIGVLRHDERTPSDKAVSRKNESIEPSRTQYNYNLAPARQGTLQEHIKAVCERNGVRLNNRKDINVMSSWVITLPKELQNGYSLNASASAFFEGCYKFLCDRYGQESVLTATVHLDETTPHMHFGFIPIGTDKNGQKTVSSKIVCSRAELRAFHKDLSAYFEQKWGRKLSIENGATAEGNKSIDELKRKSATERLRETEQKCSVIVSKAKGDIDTLKEQKNALERKINALESDLMTSKEVYSVNAKKGVGGKIRLSESEFERLRDTASQAERLKEELKSVKSDLRKSEETLLPLKEERLRLRNQNCNLESELQDTKEQLQVLQKAVAQMPSKIKALIEHLADDNSDTRYRGR